MAHLYINANGYPVKSHSHSGGGDWSCPKRYYWKRVQGWQQKEEGCSLAFGKAVEAALQYYHTTGFEPGSGVEEFKLLWFKQKDNSEIKYTEKSGDWDTHYRMGTELLRLYEWQLPDLPITNAKFQQEYIYKMFPDENSPYHGLRFKSIIDMVCTADARHPALPKTGIEGDVQFVVDIKTSANPYYTDPRMSSLDDQLRDYAWSTGLPMVAFLVLVKNPTDMTTGDWVTVLEGPKAGKKYQVFDISEERILVLPKEFYDEFQSRKKEIKGKGSKEKLEALTAEYFYKGLRVQRSEITKQRIQFLPAVISEQDAQEAKREAIHEAMDIADHAKENYWPKHPGVRFPHNVCISCDCLGLCIGDEAMVREKLVQINEVF